MDFQLNLTSTDAFVSNGNIKLYLFRMDLVKWKVSGLEICLHYSISIKNQQFSDIWDL